MSHGAAGAAIDLGWGDSGTAEIQCQAKIVSPGRSHLAFLASHLCCADENQHHCWRPAKVSVYVEGEPGQEETVICCKIDCGRSETVRTVRFSAIRGLRSLRPAFTAGVEIIDEDHSSRLMLASCTEESTSASIRLQLLHAFLAGAAEAYKHAVDIGAIQVPNFNISPLDWPLEGRQVSLAYLARVLKGVQQCDATDVDQHAKFAGGCCPICLEKWEDIQDPLSVATLACGHAFCQECLNGAIREGNTGCPTCRRTIGSFPAPEPVPEHHWWGH